MKLKHIAILLCTCCILTSCKNADLSEEPSDLFFAWTEGYLASPIGEERSIALTFYCTKNKLPFDISEIINVQFKDISEQSVSIQYTVKLLDMEEESGHLAYSVYLNYTPRELGVFEAESIEFTLMNGDKSCHSFGKITFDIDAKDSEAIDTWESEAASSNSAFFPYRYQLNDSDAKLTKIQIGLNEIISDVDGLDLSGRLNIVKTYSAPVVIISAKLLVEYNNESYISYGKGCYCGAINASESILKISQEHWSSIESG